MAGTHAHPERERDITHHKHFAQVVPQVRDTKYNYRRFSARVQKKTIRSDIVWCLYDVCMVDGTLHVHSISQLYIGECVAQCVFVWPQNRDNNPTYTPNTHVHQSRACTPRKCSRVERPRAARTHSCVVFIQHCWSTWCVVASSGQSILTRYMHA